MSFMIETSARHIHLTQETVEKLFGEGYQLTIRKPLSYPGQYASNERLTIVGPKKEMANVSILGPTRKADQVEISATDARTLGINAPIRESGDVKGSGACKLIGPKGELDLTEGVIIAKRHLHVTEEDAAEMGIKNGDIVSIHSRRGQVYSRADVSDRINKGTVYMTYQWWIGKCNELTIHKVDPVSHTPEDKFSACQVDAIADQVWAEGEVERQYTELKQALVDAAAPQDVEPGAAKFDDETHVNQIV